MISFQKGMGSMVEVYPAQQRVCAIYKTRPQISTQGTSQCQIYVKSMLGYCNSWE